MSEQAFPDEPMPNEQLESVCSLVVRLNDAKTRIIDCRFDLSAPQKGRQDYLQGHIPGAVFADLDQDLASPITPESGRHPLPDVDTLARFFARCGIDADTDVVVYDASNGAMAARCWWLLRWLGHRKVRLLDGGFAAWCEAGHQLEEGVASVAAGHFEAKVNPTDVITTAELYDAYPDIRRLRLFDARDKARYDGMVEPIDAVAGHIRGSINQPLTVSLNDDGRWKSTDVLQELWGAALGDERQADWAVMCGSGVTACHLALSAVQAGYRAPRLYAGSWSEWIRDPERPISSIESEKAK